MWRSTEVYTIDGFLKSEKPKYVHKGIARKSADLLADVSPAMTVGMVVLIQGDKALAVDSHIVSDAFNRSLMPLFLDVGKVIATVTGIFGAYRVIRNDSKGWRTFGNAIAGYAILFCIQGAFDIVESVGHDIQTSIHK